MNELLPLYDATEMRALDAAAIELGIPATVLMERAGLGAAHEIMSRFPDRRRFAIVAGTGNNGTIVGVDDRLIRQFVLLPTADQMLDLSR